MRITLITGHSYEISDKKEVERLKKRIYALAKNKNQRSLEHLYHQLSPYFAYLGKDVAELNAQKCFTYLNSRFNLSAEPIQHQNNANTILNIKNIDIGPLVLKPIVKQKENNTVKKVQLKKLPITLKLRNSKVEYGNASKASIAISFRHDKGTRMYGAFFDHYVIRKITGVETCITAAECTNFKDFNHFVEVEVTFALGIGTDLGKREVPRVLEPSDKHGLLFIPGYARNNDDVVRSNYEKLLIRKAVNCGRPILAVCAGSWTLWESFGGKLREVEDHCYSSMPYILNRGVVGNNTKMHRIEVTENTVLKGAMDPKSEWVDKKPLVNSIHWLSVDENILAKDEPINTSQLTVSARSLMEPTITLKNRQQQVYSPEQGTIEAFEAQHGVPILGIQWHPECFFDGTNAKDNKEQINIINYMAKAGDAYCAKQNVLKELKEVSINLSNNSNSFFSRSNNVSLNPKEVKEEVSLLETTIKVKNF